MEAAALEAFAALADRFVTTLSQEEAAPFDTAAAEVRTQVMQQTKDQGLPAKDITDAFSAAVN